MRSDIVDLDLLFVHQTSGAVLVRLHEDADEVWLPKSQIELEESDMRRNAIYCFSMPQSLAEEKGLV